MATERQGDTGGGYVGGHGDAPQRTEFTGEHGSYAAAQRNAPLHVETDEVVADTSPDGTSEVGQAYHEESVRTGGSMTRAIIGLAILLAAILFFVLIFVLR
jgi:hypothetical protein